MLDTPLSPIDRQTAIVAFSPGERFQVEPQAGLVTSMQPLPLRDKIQANPNMVDLTGTQFERMTVIGLSRDYMGRWVVRCACGRYELRTAKAIRAGGKGECGAGLCFECNAARKGLFKHNHGL